MIACLIGQSSLKHNKLIQLKYIKKSSDYSSSFYIRCFISAVLYPLLFFFLREEHADLGAFSFFAVDFCCGMSHLAQSQEDIHRTIGFPSLSRSVSFFITSLMAAAMTLLDSIPSLSSALVWTENMRFASSGLKPMPVSSTSMTL